ncbi:MAG: AtpZ/AtpI family protein [Calditrichaeota bacterium]|nr:AtpZ/AtpI family protein [Calditrichota bacterium]
MPLRDTLQNATAYTHLGLTLAVSTLGFFYLGWWLDGKWGTRPLVAILGAFIGMAGGFVNVVRTLNRLRDEQDKADAEKSNEN